MTVHVSDEEASSAPTLLMLQLQYRARATIPIEWLVRDFFPHLTVEKFLRKTLRGDIPLPILRIEQSQKASRQVDLRDLAHYLDERRAAATREARQLSGP